MFVNSVNDFIKFAIERRSQIWTLFLQHIQLTVFSVLISIAIGIPLGIIIIGKKKTSSIVIGIANIIQSVPTIALLGFLIPVLGIGSKPAIIMVVMYSLLPIVKNTFTGLNNVDGAIVEAANGIGLTKRQVLLKVRLPLAMPIIMSGIRISAVTAVGLMTLAAFIGAGGLGYLVFSGVQTVNNNMILSGAIPACILALALDFIIGKIENMLVVTRLSDTNKKKKNRMLTKFIYKHKLLILGVIIVALVGFEGYNYYESRNTIIIGSQNSNEQIILGNMLGILIKNDTNYKIDEKLDLGGTSVVFDAMVNGDVDLYVEYTGSGLMDIMHRKSNSNSKEVYNTVKEYYKKNYKIDWLSPLGFNNTYILAMNRNLAKKNNINSISDLSKISNKLVLGSTMEFLNRSDGYLGLQKVYGLKFKSTKGLDAGLRYDALSRNETQVADAFSTDGILEKMNFKTLKDDKNFFPPYDAVPIVRESTLKKYPKLKPVLEKLKGKITYKDMRKMNYAADKGGDPKAIAENFLRSKNLIN